MGARRWFFVILVLYAAYGCVLIISYHYGIAFPFQPFYRTAFIYDAVPWITIWGGVAFWRRMWKWRMIRNEAIKHDHISRGHYQAAMLRDKASQPERFFKFVTLLGATALIYQFHIPHPEWICAAFLLLWLVLGLCFKSLNKGDK